MRTEHEYNIQQYDWFSNSKAVHDNEFNFEINQINKLIGVIEYKKLKNNLNLKIKLDKMYSKIKTEFKNIPTIQQNTNIVNLNKKFNILNEIDKKNKNWNLNNVYQGLKKEQIDKIYVRTVLKKYEILKYILGDIFLFKKIEQKQKNDTTYYKQGDFFSGKINFKYNPTVILNNHVIKKTIDVFNLDGEVEELNHDDDFTKTITNINHNKNIECIEDLNIDKKNIYSIDTIVTIFKKIIINLRNKSHTNNKLKNMIDVNNGFLVNNKLENRINNPLLHGYEAKNIDYFEKIKNIQEFGENINENNFPNFYDYVYDTINDDFYNEDLIELINIKKNKKTNPPANVDYLNFKTPPIKNNFKLLSYKTKIIKNLIMKKNYIAKFYNLYIDKKNIINMNKLEILKKIEIIQTTKKQQKNNYAYVLKYLNY
jgi:hypothetical protein